MGEKNKKNRLQLEHFNTAMHVVTLADSVLEQIGRPGPEQVSPSMPTRIAEWPKNPKSISFRLEQYDYDDETKKYLFETIDTEGSTIFMFRTRGRQEPKLYRLDEGGIEIELEGDEGLEKQNYLRQVLANANEQATKKAETRSIDREFEKVIGRYILSDLALRPLAKTYEDGLITPEKVTAYSNAFNARTKAIEQEILQHPPVGYHTRTQRAVKNKPVGGIFMELNMKEDAHLLAGLAAREIGDVWSNTIDTSKPPADEPYPEAS